MTKASLDEAANILKGLGPVWVHIAEYRMTHAHIHVLLTNEHFERLADVYLADTLSISGLTSGGPWRCSLKEEVEGGDLHVVFSTDGLTIKGLRVHFVGPGEDVSRSTLEVPRPWTEIAAKLTPTPIDSALGGRRNLDESALEKVIIELPSGDQPEGAPGSSATTKCRKLGIGRAAPYES